MLSYRSGVSEPLQNRLKVLTAQLAPDTYVGVQERLPLGPDNCRLWSRQATRDNFGYYRGRNFLQLGVTMVLQESSAADRAREMSVIHSKWHFQVCEASRLMQRQASHVLVYYKPHNQRESLAQDELRSSIHHHTTMAGGLNKEYAARQILLDWDSHQLKTMNEFIDWKTICTAQENRGIRLTRPSIEQINIGYNPELDTIMQAVDAVQFRQRAGIYADIEAEARGHDTIDDLLDQYEPTIDRQYFTPSLGNYTDNVQSVQHSYGAGFVDDDEHNLQQHLDDVSHYTFNGMGLAVSPNSSVGSRAISRAITEQLACADLNVSSSYVSEYIPSLLPSSDSNYEGGSSDYSYMDNSQFVYEPVRINNSPVSDAEVSIKRAIAIIHSAVSSPISLENGHDSSLCIVSSEEGALWHIGVSPADDLSVSDQGPFLYSYATPEDIQQAYGMRNKDYVAQLTAATYVTTSDLATIDRLRAFLDYYKMEHKKQAPPRKRHVPCVITKNFLASYLNIYKEEGAMERWDGVRAALVRGIQLMNEATLFWPSNVGDMIFWLNVTKTESDFFSGNVPRPDQRMTYTDMNTWYRHDRHELNDLRVRQRQQNRRHEPLTASRNILLVRPGKEGILRIEGSDHDLYNSVGYITHQCCEIAGLTWTDFKKRDKFQNTVSKGRAFRRLQLPQLSRYGYVSDMMRIFPSPNVGGVIQELGVAYGGKTMSQSASRRLAMQTITTVFDGSLDAWILEFLDIDSVVNAISFEIDKVRQTQGHLLRMMDRFALYIYGECEHFFESSPVDRSFMLGVIQQSFIHFQGLEVAVKHAAFMLAALRAKRMKCLAEHNALRQDGCVIVDDESIKDVRQLRRIHDKKMPLTRKLAEQRAETNSTFAAGNPGLRELKGVRSQRGAGMKELDRRLYKAHVLTTVAITSRRILRSGKAQKCARTPDR